MGTNGLGIWSAAFGLFAACSSDSAGGRDPGTAATGGNVAGSAGQAVSGTSGQATGGSAGSSGAGGASAAGGAASGSAGGGATSAGAAGRGDAGSAGNSAGAAGNGGALGGGGSSEGGTMSGAGGAAGVAGVGGASGTAGSDVVGLSWPIDCVPNETCVGIGYPDIDEDGDAFDCSDPGYFGHQGTDIRITEEAQDAGTAVRAAADGVVLFAFDGKFDRCPNESEPDCQPPPGDEPGATTGTTVCTPVGPYCGVGEDGCYWCFAGGNVIVIRHEGVPGVFATRYDHLKRDSLLVEPGDAVARGQKIAEAASAGASTAPHLHFEVWGTGFYELAEPWAGTCGPNTGPSLWAYDPPWSG